MIYRGRFVLHISGTKPSRRVCWKPKKMSPLGATILGRFFQRAARPGGPQMAFRRQYGRNLRFDQRRSTDEQGATLLLVGSRITLRGSIGLRNLLISLHDVCAERLEVSLEFRPLGGRPFRSIGPRAFPSQGTMLCVKRGELLSHRRFCSWPPSHDISNATREACIHRLQSGDNRAWHPARE